MSKKMGLILKLILAAAVSAILYIFLHEGGHALTAVLCGAKITSFSIIGAHTSWVGGSFSQATASLSYIAGMLLPVILSACWLLFCFNPKKTGELYRLFTMLFWLIPAGSLLAWIFVPIAFMTGDTTNPDDVIQFLEAVRHPSLYRYGTEYRFLAAFILLAWKKGIVRSWLDMVSGNKKR